MTTLEIIDAELVVDDEQFDRARQITLAIKGLVGRAQQGLNDLADALAFAYNEKVWQTLGYDGWGDYIVAEFGTNMIKFPRPERKELEQRLSKSGLSLRAIATSLGVDVATVSRDVNPKPEPGPAEEVPGQDRVASIQGESVANATEEPIEEEDQPEPPAPRKKTPKKSPAQKQLEDQQHFVANLAKSIPWTDALAEELRDRVDAIITLQVGAEK